MELLPCPFCGGAADIVGEFELDAVACQTCYARTDAFAGDGEHAAAAWNRRAPDPALLALAKFGALMCRNADWPEPPEEQYQECAYIDLASYEVDLLMDEAGLLLPDGDGSPTEGVRAAIARLLAPADGDA